MRADGKVCSRNTQAGTAPPPVLCCLPGVGGAQGGLGRISLFMSVLCWVLLSERQGLLPLMLNSIIIVVMMTSRDSHVNVCLSTALYLLLDEVLGRVESGFTAHFRLFKVSA